jgi:hypothetical protein
MPHSARSSRVSLSCQNARAHGPLHYNLDPSCSSRRAREMGRVILVQPTACPDLASESYRANPPAGPSENHTARMPESADAVSTVDVVLDRAVEASARWVEGKQHRKKCTQNLMQEASPVSSSQSSTWSTPVDSAQLRAHQTPGLSYAQLYISAGISSPVHGRYQSPYNTVSEVPPLHTDTNSPI